jgi:hypothetical protein
LLIEVLVHQGLLDQKMKPFKQATSSRIVKERLYHHTI